MSIASWLAFVAAAAVVLVIPGPTILTVISYSLSHGRRVNLVLVAAVVLGDSTALAMSLLGLGALLATSLFWFTAVKLVGSIYLLYLGVRLLRSGARPALVVAPARRPALWKLFGDTFLVTALNPKSIMFFVAFLPQFIDHSRPAAVQLWLLAATFVVLAGINAALYAAFAGSARRLLSTSRAHRRFTLAGGSLLCAAGLWSLFANRTAP